MWVQTLLAALAAYLLGSFPSAYLLARLKGRDIFAVGSGNMGAMNTARNLGYGLGALVFLLDVGKGVLASYLGLLIGGESLAPAFAACVGVAAGHAWSLFAGFRGGKALATGWGAVTLLLPWGGALAIVTLTVLSLSLKGRSVLAAVIVICLFPLMMLLDASFRYPQASTVTTAIVGSSLMAAVVLYKHLPGLRQENASFRRE